MTLITYFKKFIPYIFSIGCHSKKKRQDMIVAKHVCSRRCMYKLKPCIWNPHLIGLMQHNNHQLVVSKGHIDKTMF